MGNEFHLFDNMLQGSISLADVLDKGVDLKLLLLLSAISSGQRILHLVEALFINDLAILIHHAGRIAQLCHRW